MDREVSATTVTLASDYSLSLVTIRDVLLEGWNSWEVSCLKNQVEDEEQDTTL